MRVGLLLLRYVNWNLYEYMDTDIDILILAHSARLRQSSESVQCAMLKACNARADMGQL